MLVSPHPDDHGVVRWAISVTDDNGTPLLFSHDLPIDADPAAVVTHVHDLMAEAGITAPHH